MSNLRCGFNYLMMRLGVIQLDQNVVVFFCFSEVTPVKVGISSELVGNNQQNRVAAHIFFCNSNRLGQDIHSFVIASLIDELSRGLCAHGKTIAKVLNVWMFKKFV